MTISLDDWMADDLGLALDGPGPVAMTKETTTALADAVGVEERAFLPTVQSLLREHDGRPAFEMRTGGWRIDLPAATARAVVAGSLAVATFRDLGLVSLPAVAASAIAAALFTVERVDVNPSDLAVHVLLRDVGDDVASLPDLHQRLPRHVREEVTPRELADVVDRLTDAGLTKWDDRGRLVRKASSTRLVFHRPGERPTESLLDRLATEIHPDGRTDRPERVFVVHGRDMGFRDRFFKLLDGLGVRPLEWEPLVDETGSTVPTVLDVVNEGIAPRQAQAVVVLMTPDDVVMLHPSLRSAREDAHEMVAALQPRPNVLVELGIALALFPKSTIIVMAGSQRPIGDLNGLNVVRFDGSAGRIDKVASRLAMAGCPVADIEDARDDLAALFTGLDTFDREPPDGGAV